MKGTKPHLHIALALIWRGGEVLVSRRLATAAHLPGVWEFPGGKVEADELPALAAVREAREEVGLEVEVVAVREPIEWEYEKRFVTLHPFDCRIVGGEVGALEVGALEVAEVRFLAPSDLKVEEYPPANARLIADLQGAH